jgi:hypothetical protein
VTVTALLVGLLAAEALARACTTAVAAAPRYEGEVIAPSAQPARGWELVAGASCTMTYPQPDGREVVLRHVVGAHGWRGEAFDRAPGAGVERIACVGDSNVFGWGVADGDTFAEQLERELARDGREVEVLNLGVPNTNAEEKVALVERVALELDCDVIVLELFFDDATLDGVQLGRLGGNAELLGYLRPGRFPWLDELREDSRAVDVLCAGLRQRLGSQAYVARVRRAMQPGGCSRTRIERALARVGALARERGVELVVVVMPYPVRIGGAWASACIDATLVASARDAGLRTLDLGPALAEIVSEPLYVHALDLHVNARGQHAAAVATAKFLRE